MSTTTTIVLLSISYSVKLDPKTGMTIVEIPPGHHQIIYTVPSTIRTVPGANDTVAVYKGALLYALEIVSYNTSTLPKKYYDPTEYYHGSYAPPEVRDWEYHNLSSWNYAIDPSSLTYHEAPGEVDAADYKLANPIFAPGAPPGYMTALACEIERPLFKHSVPGYAPTAEKKKCISDVKEVKLTPYGAAKTHMAELPVIDLSKERRKQYD